MINERSGAAARTEKGGLSDGPAARGEAKAAAIRTVGLSKKFGDLEAVQSLNFEMERGTMYALVGPDGAGKTTTLRMLCGIIPPTEGEALILGFDLLRDRKKLKHRVGYLSQGFSLYEDLSVDENIEFFAEIHKVGDFRERRRELLEFTRLGEFHTRLAGRLSGGMKKKLALACSLVHRPEILFLDEPTTGVDPVSRRDFWLILSQVLREGVSILVTTPYLDEAERCNGVGLLDSGRLLAVDSPEGIRGRMEDHMVEFAVSDVRRSTELLPQDSSFWCREVQLFGDRFDVRSEDVPGTIRRTKELLEKGGVEVYSAREVKPSLENVFISMLRKEDKGPGLRNSEPGREADQLHGKDGKK